jgi:hypothetical protein
VRRQRSDLDAVATPASSTGGEDKSSALKALRASEAARREADARVKELTARVNSLSLALEKAKRTSQHSTEEDLPTSIATPSSRCDPTIVFDPA